MTDKETLEMAAECSRGVCSFGCPLTNEEHCIERMLGDVTEMAERYMDMNRAKQTEPIVNSNLDQKAKADAGKPRLTLIPPQILYDIAEVREYGCKKYPDGGPDNWKTVDIQRYKDALARHTLSYLACSSDKDSESGLNHLKHVACNVAFLCQLEAEKDGKTK